MSLKVGDRVIRVNYGNGGVEVGDQGVVAGFYGEDTSCVNVTWDRYQDILEFYADADNLELLQVEITPKLSPAEVQRQIDKALYTKPTNPKDRAATHRLDLSLFPQSAVIYGALAMTEGDCKYGGYNYRVSGVNMSVYVAAFLRHVYKAYNGEWVDPVTKVPHFANAIACLAVLIDGYEHGNLNDDRPPVQDTADLLKRSEEIVKHLNELFPNGPSRCTQLGQPSME